MFVPKDFVSDCFFAKLYTRITARTDILTLDLYSDLHVINIMGARQSSRPEYSKISVHHL